MSVELGADPGLLTVRPQVN